MFLPRLALDRPVLLLSLSPATSLVDLLLHPPWSPDSSPESFRSLRSLYREYGPIGLVSGWLDVGASWYPVLFFGTHPLNGFVEREFPWTGPVRRRLHDGCIMSWPG